MRLKALANIVTAPFMLIAGALVVLGVLILMACGVREFTNVAKG